MHIHTMIHTQIPYRYVPVHAQVQIHQWMRGRPKQIAPQSIHACNDACCECGDLCVSPPCLEMTNRLEDANVLDNANVKLG